MRKYPFEGFLVEKSLSIRDALQRIEDTERRTLFVVAADQTLEGVVTDGDIRRWLLAGGDFNADLSGVTNYSPFYAHTGYNREKLRDRMLDLGAAVVPLVNDQHKVIGIIFWEDVLGEQAHPRHLERLNLPVVVMAGGQGTRMAPFTTVLPKPLLPVGDKTVIETIINRFVEFGAKDFYLTVNYKAILLKAFFQELCPAYNVEFIEEKEPMGTAGSLALFRDRIESDIILTNCDLVIQADYPELAAQHQKEGNAITMVVSLKNYNIPYGVCEIEKGGELKRIIEKPEYNFMVNTGMYVISRPALDLVKAEGLYHMTDLIEAVRADGGRVGVYPIGENSWLDTGQWEEYRRTIQHLETEGLS